MLEIFNNLEEFFKDNYRRINVREYARLIGVSPPSASKILSIYYQEGLLLKEKEKNYIFYVANRENKPFIDLSRLYWYIRLKKIGLIEHLEKELISPLVILFGSFSKAEVSKNSDIDIAILTISKKLLSLGKYEKLIKRHIHLFIFSDYTDIKNKDLLKNIFNGFVLAGNW